MFNFILHPPSRLWRTSVFKNFHYVFDDGFHRIRVNERPVRKTFASSKRSETDTCARGPTHAIFSRKFARFLFLDICSSILINITDDEIWQEKLYLE